MSSAGTAPHAAATDLRGGREGLEVLQHFGLDGLQLVVVGVPPQQMPLVELEPRQPGNGTQRREQVAPGGCA